MKNNSKSIRVSDEVLNYIQSYRGNGFNEKFENIILDALVSEKERLERVKNLDIQIAEKEEQLTALIVRFRKLDPMLQVALHLNSRLIELEKELDEILPRK